VVDFLSRRKEKEAEAARKAELREALEQASFLIDEQLYDEARAMIADLMAGRPPVAEACELLWRIDSMTSEEWQTETSAVS
jgi:hypothetical protein